jgi:hypothetical protein
MAIPSASDARLFYRCAFQRYDDAQVLLRAEHTTGAVYLAGYGVECILKALILMAVAPGDRSATLQSFRGGRAHDFEWLRTQYLTNGGARFPRDVNQYFTLVNDWSTDLRYTPRSVREGEADAFLIAAAAIIRWADGRL